MPRPLPLAPLGVRGRVSRPHWPLVSASISGLLLSEAAVARAPINRCCPEEPSPCLTRSDQTVPRPQTQQACECFGRPGGTGALVDCRRRSLPCGGLVAERPQKKRLCGSTVARLQDRGRVGGAGRVRVPACASVFDKLLIGLTAVI